MGQAQGVKVKQMKTGKKNNPPGPSGLPVVGNLLQFDRSKPLTYLTRLSDTYGPLTYLKHGSTPTLLISSGELAKQVLNTHDLSFCTRPPVLGQQKLSYNGADIAFSPYNSHWREMRKMCMHHFFSPNHLLTFRPIREDQVGRMVSRISGLAMSGRVANLSDMAMSLASNIICGLAFGRTYEEHEYEKKRLGRLVLEAQALMVSFYFSDHFPLLGWVVDRMSGLLRRLDNNFRELDAFYLHLIDQHLRPSASAAPLPDREDIIDLMINLKRQKPESITWDHIKALLMDVFVAGTDTVAAAIVWTMTALVMRPAVMKKTQAEIREAIGYKKGIIVEDELGKLPFLKAVVMEALRLYPPAPLLYRTQVSKKNGNDDDGAVVIGGYEMEPGTTFIINGWAIARDPETWADAEEFVPERFLGKEENLEFENAMMMIPFGGGRRGCPGRGMGMVSVHLALANLLYSFDWALPPSAPPIDTHALPGLTMHKKNSLLLLPIINHALP